jgi:hypothetical protein
MPDGCLIAALRGNTVFDSGRMTFPPGGYIDFNKKSYWDFDPDNSKVATIRLDKEAQREIQEELPGMPWTHLRTFGIVHSLVDSCQPLIAGMIETPYTASKVMATYGAYSNNEMKQVICVPADLNSLRDFAKKYTLCVHDVYKLAFYVASTFEDPAVI